MKRLWAFFVTERVGLRTSSTAAVRVVVGLVFIVSGAMKFVFDNAGPARFAKIGIPAPAETSTFVGLVEVIAGCMLVAGLFARLAALPLVMDMAVAIATTKVPLLFGGGPEIPAAAPRAGFWAFAYQARLDVTMFVLCFYVVAVGAGLFSLDAARRTSTVKWRTTAPTSS